MKNLVKYIAVLLCSILSVSCVFDAEKNCVQMTPVVLEGERTISFTIGFDHSTTRVECDETDRKVPFDHYIQPGTLRVMMTDTDNTIIGEVERLSIWPTNAEQTEFMFTGKLPDGFVFDPASPNYKFHSIVNAPLHALDEELVLYHYQQLDPRNENSAIPMWGVMTVDLSPITGTTNYEIPNPMWMLRSAAKVEVELSDALKAKDTKITAAMLKYYNVEGYVAPANWHTFNNTKDLDCEKVINVYRHAAVNLPLIKNEETGDYYVYMPEYNNIDYPGERNKISLTLVHGGKEIYVEDAISFCEYSNGKLVVGSDYNITRNHIYRFSIRSIAGSNLSLEYHVADWDAEDWGTGKDYEEHDISYPTYLNPIVPEEYLTLQPNQYDNYTITQTPSMYYGGENNLEIGAFVGYFRILAPLDVQWKPGFMGSKENYRIRVYKKGGKDDGKLLFDSGVASLQGNLSACGSDEWYKIVIFPLSSEGADETTIQLGISYYQEWTDQYINLFVNGEYDNIRWPNSGTNPKIIDIHHVGQTHYASDEV